MAKQSPECRISTEYSIRPLDALHLDCLLAIIHHLPLLDLLRLRLQSRSLNDAVCQYLRTSCRKLELHLDTDRSGDDLQRVRRQFDHHEVLYHKYYLHHRQYRLDQTRSITFEDTVRLQSHLFKNQPPFRSENLTQVRSAEGLTDRKVDSLIHFLTTYMSNLRKLALLISHEDYFRFVGQILFPLRKLKVLFIDATSSVARGSGYLNYPATETVDVISGLPELESLYYFRNYYTKCTFRSRPDYTPQRLSTGENFLEVLLARLRVLHCHYFAFPVGMTFDKIQEISIDENIVDSVTKNYFPAVKTLFINYLDKLYTQLDDGRSSFVNVKILKLYTYWDDHRWHGFCIDSEDMRPLNELPNLEELHCRCVDYLHERRQSVVERNYKIVRLYSQCHQNCIGSDCKLDFCEDTNCIEPEEMAEYASVCKEFFRGLKSLTNKHPPLVQRF